MSQRLDRLLKEVLEDVPDTLCVGVAALKEDSHFFRDKALSRHISHMPFMVTTFIDDQELEDNTDDQLKDMIRTRLTDNLFNIIGICEDLKASLGD